MASFASNGQQTSGMPKGSEGLAMGNTQNNHGVPIEGETWIDADTVTGIDVAREGTSEVAVRVYVRGSAQPRVFKFQDMTSALAYYKDLWSRRQQN